MSKRAVCNHEIGMNWWLEKSHQCRDDLVDRAGWTVIKWRRRKTGGDARPSIG